MNPNFLILLCFVISSCINKMTFSGNYDTACSGKGVKDIDNIKISYVVPNTRFRTPRC